MISIHFEWSMKKNNNPIDTMDTMEKVDNNEINILPNV